MARNIQVVILKKAFFFRGDFSPLKTLEKLSKLSVVGLLNLMFKDLETLTNQQVAPKKPTGSGKGSNPSLLGATINFR